jgi:hypothetical protein
MREYKYVVFDIDIKINPANEIIYHKGQLYEIVEMRTTFNDEKILIQTKYPSTWKIFDENSKLLTISDIRRMKLETIKQKI